MQIYEHLWEDNLDNHITNMRKDGYWGNNLELLAFSDLMRLNINILQFQYWKSKLNFNWFL